MNEGDVIFLSASVPIREGWAEDAQPAEIEEAIVSIARAVFARNGRLLFGGHPSVSPLVAAVAGEYFASDPARRIRPVVTFQSEFFRGRVPDETTEMVRMGWSAIEWTRRIPGDTPDDPDPSLRLMRELMLSGSGDEFKGHELRPPRAMIAVGGMDGVRDEADMFLQKRRMWGLKPLPRVYAFKSGRGAAARLVDRASMTLLWPGKAADHRVFATLKEALDSRDILDAEDAWRREHPNVLLQAPFEPYAAIAQWLLDELPAR